MRGRYVHLMLHQHPRATDTVITQGTLPFISWHLLVAPEPITHKVHHDLESFFYVLVWACIVLEEPGRYRRNFDITKTRLKWWMVGDSIEETGSMKQSTMVGNSFNLLLRDFSPYFEPIKPIVRDLCDYIIRREWNDYPEYEPFLDILTRGRDAMPQIDDPLPAPVREAGEVVLEHQPSPHESELGPEENDGDDSDQEEGGVALEHQPDPHESELDPKKNGGDDFELSSSGSCRLDDLLPTYVQEGYETAPQRKSSSSKVKRIRQENDDNVYIPFTSGKDRGPIANPKSMRRSKRSRSSTYDAGALS
jgi:hypothetical protein